MRQMREHLEKNRMKSRNRREVWPRASVSRIHFRVLSDMWPSSGSLAAGHLIYLPGLANLVKPSENPCKHTQADQNATIAYPYWSRSRYFPLSPPPCSLSFLLLHSLCIHAPTTPLPFHYDGRGWGRCGSRCGRVRVPGSGGLPADGYGSNTVAVDMVTDAVCVV